MKAYELLFILDPNLTDENRAATMARIDGAITGVGGSVQDVDEWGRRKLAYEIDHLQEGDYTLIKFQADPDQIEELERILRITDAVKRSMITRQSE